MENVCGRISCFYLRFIIFCFRFLDAYYAYLLILWKVDLKCSIGRPVSRIPPQSVSNLGQITVVVGIRGLFPSNFEHGKTGLKASTLMSVFLFPGIFCIAFQFQFQKCFITWSIEYYSAPPPHVSLGRVRPY